MSNHRSPGTPGTARTARTRFVIILLIFAALVTIAVTAGSTRRGWSAEEQADLIAPSDTAACLECHADGMDAKQLQQSAHGKLVCQNCHKGINQYPHPEQAVAKKPACTDCHAEISAALASSAHRPVKAAKPRIAPSAMAPKGITSARLPINRPPNSKPSAYSATVQRSPV
jgi:hypothetical protein